MQPHSCFPNPGLVSSRAQTWAVTRNQKPDSPGLPLQPLTKHLLSLPHTPWADIIGDVLMLTLYGKSLGSLGT